MGLEDMGWTADFNEFRKKVEPLFGSLEKLVIDDMHLFGHQVMSHGFIEYAGLTDVYARTKEEVAGSEDKFHSVIRDSNNNLQKDYDKQYYVKLKEKFVEWANENVLNYLLSKYQGRWRDEFKEEIWPVVLETSWQEYLDD